MYPTAAVLNLTDVNISGGSRSYEDSWVRFSSGAMGSVTNSTFGIPLAQYSGSKAEPLVTFSGKHVSGADGAIHVRLSG